jgi:protein-S-isoprenylcysteine O-methyltransferase Ste14
MTTTDSSPRPPPSATHYGINLLGVFAALVAIVFLRERHDSSTSAILTVCVAGVVPIVALDVLLLRVHRRASTGLDWDRPSSSANVGRCATKLLGLAVTVAPFALAYFVFPEYGDWYGVFWDTLRRAWPSLVVASIAYTFLVDGLMREPHDAYWQLGRVALGHFSDAKRGEIANHYRGWLVKAFYIPLFVVFTHNQIGGILKYDLAGAASDNLRLYDFLHEGVYALDVLYATVGYLMASRLLDTHLRSAEPTMLGWMVTLECYQPFWGRLSSSVYLHYDGIGFEQWLAGNLSLRWAWAAVILLLEIIYLLATFAFGVRFSNLTHRGILTNGPYRYSKHPAYVAKNLSWWLTTLPFIPNHGWVSALKSSLALGGVSAIYFLRARTEERHLSRDPTYVAYAQWMNEHGVLRFLNRLPFFRYKAPAAAPPAPEAPPPPEPSSTPQESPQ